MSKPTPNEPDPINRDTPHAKLLRRLLISGGLRQWRLEKCIEGVVTLRELVTGSKGSEAIRAEAIAKIVENAFRLALEYGDSLSADAAGRQYRWVQVVLADRLAKAESKAVAK